MDWTQDPKGVFESEQRLRLGGLFVMSAKTSGSGSLQPELQLQQTASSSSSSAKLRSNVDVI